MSNVPDPCTVASPPDAVLPTAQTASPKPPEGTSRVPSSLSPLRFACATLLVSIGLSRPHRSHTAQNAAAARPADGGFSRLREYISAASGGKRIELTFALAEKQGVSIAIPILGIAGWGNLDRGVYPPHALRKSGKYRTYFVKSEKSEERVKERD